jgi:hypothetical protein
MNEPSVCDNRPKRHKQQRAYNRPKGAKTFKKAKVANRRVAKVEELLEYQGRDGNWNESQYSLGLHNGLAIAVAVLRGDESAKLRRPPKKFLNENVDSAEESTVQ